MASEKNQRGGNMGPAPKAARRRSENPPPEEGFRAGGAAPALVSSTTGKYAWWVLKLTLVMLAVLGIRSCGNWMASRDSAKARTSSPIAAQMGEGYVVLKPAGTHTISVPPGGGWTKIYSTPLGAARAWYITTNDIRAKCFFSDGTSQPCDASPTRWVELKGKPSGFRFKNTHFEATIVELHTR